MAPPDGPKGDGPTPAPTPSEAVALAPGQSASAEASQADMDRAKAFFAARCRVCHGPEGRGNGPMAGTLRPPPRSFADAGWQQGAQDEAIAAIILKGGAAVGRSAAMPAAPELARQPGTLAGLVRLVRACGASGSAK